MILKFSRKNLIESSSSSSDSDNNYLDRMRLMEKKNPFIRLAVFSKIKRLFNSFNGESLTQIDKNLLRGLYLRKLKDFEEDY